MVRPTAKAKDAAAIGAPHLALAESSTIMRTLSPSAGQRAKKAEKAGTDGGDVEIPQSRKVKDADSPHAAREEKDPIKILATGIHAANASDQDHFFYSMEGPETYNKAMQCRRAAQ